jgi:hypothetical protein
MNKTLGSFYICFKERNAIEKSIASFKKFYPDAPMYLTSDGGYDYSYLEKQYKNMKCVLDKEMTVGITKDIEKMIATNSFPIVSLFMAAMQFVIRLKKAIDFCKTDYIFLMEPDVFVRGEMSLTDYDFVGAKPNPMPPQIQKYITDNGGYNNVAWGGAAGIIKTESYNVIYNDLIDNQHKMLEWLYMDPRIACYDYLLTFLFSIYGFRYEDNPELTECNRNPNWRTSNHPLLHQYYENYTSDNGDTGKHHGTQHFIYTT